MNIASIKNNQIPLEFLKELIPFAIKAFLFVYILFLLSDGLRFLLFLIAGFALGAYFTYIGTSSSSSSSNGHIDIFQKYGKYLDDKKTHPSSTDADQEDAERITVNDGRVELFYSALTDVVNPLLECIMKDYVSSWWEPLNIYHDVQFEKTARERLNLMVLNVEKILMNQERNDIVMSVLYGLANTLIIHMRECRALEESNLTIEQFIFQNPQSPFAQLLSKEEQQIQLRNLSALFLKRTLPNTTDTLLTSLFNELLATYLFGGIIDTFSDPDYLNSWIVEFLQPTSATEAGNHKMTLLTPPDTPNLSTLKITTTNTTTTTTTQTAQQSASSASPTSTVDTAMIPTMIFPLGTVNFTIMDISQPSHSPPDKSEMLYIIQVERPAATLQQHHPSSEGGGYVITRTYADFESFHTILSARHFDKVRALQLKLPSFLPSSSPTSASGASSWLPKGNHGQTTSQCRDISKNLENYIDTVVQDEELGTEPIILPFLRKERQSEDENRSFADEYKAEVANAYSVMLASSLSNNTSTSSLARTKSLFSKQTSSSPAISSTSEKGRSSMSSIRSNASSFSSTSELQATNTNQQHSSSTSSIRSPSSTTTASHKQSAMPLSTMDVELLIETTYALVIETFQLSAGSYTGNKKATWMRRSILNLLREIVRRSYTQFISEQYNDFVEAYISPDAIVHMLDQLQKNFWPEEELVSSDSSSSHSHTLKEDEVKGRGDTGAEKQDAFRDSSIDISANRTNDKNKQLARDLLLTELIPSTVRQLIGDQNCNMAMHRIWARCQNRDLNRVLILQVLERIIKPILG